MKGKGYHWYRHFGSRLMFWLIGVLVSLVSNLLLLLGYLVVICFKPGKQLILAMRQNDLF